MNSPKRSKQQEQESKSKCQTLASCLDLNPQILETWIKSFPALDGQSGRPTLIQCIERAVTDPLLDKTQSLRVWVEQALRLDSRNHIESYMQEKYCL